MKPMHKSEHEPHNGSRHGLVAEAKGRFSDLTKEAMSVEGEVIDEAKKRGAELLENAQATGQKAWKRTARWIGKNPGSAVGVAFVIGVVLKSWFGRSEE